MGNFFVNTIDKTCDFKNGYRNLFYPDPLIYRSIYDAIAEDNPVIRYGLTLTGAGDSKSDVTIPMKSFQCRYRSGDPTFFSCVVPYSSTYATYVNDRPNGELVMTMYLYSPGTLALLDSAEVVRVDLENVRKDEGGRNKTITLEGHKTVAWESQSITLENAIYKLTDDGRIMFRFPTPHIYLRPGDELTVGSDTITVGLITYYVQVDNGGSVSQQMDVQEAA